VNWDKIMKKKIVRKTVAIHPIMDYYVRLVQSILTQQLAAEGIDVDVSYSVALNYMLLWVILAVAHNGLMNNPEVLETLWDFLYDKKTIERLNLAEMEARFTERIRKITITLREKIKAEE